MGRDSEARRPSLYSDRLTVACIGDDAIIDAFAHDNAEAPLRIGRGFCHCCPIQVNNVDVCALYRNIAGEVDGAVDDFSLGIRECSQLVGMCGCQRQNGEKQSQRERPPDFARAGRPEGSSQDIIRTSGFTRCRKTTMVPVIAASTARTGRCATNSNCAAGRNSRPLSASEAPRPAQVSAMADPPTAAPHNQPKSS